MPWRRTPGKLTGMLTEPERDDPGRAGAIDRLADRLTAQGLRPGEVLAVCAPSSIELNAASLAYERGRWDEAVAELDASSAVDWATATEHHCLRILIAGHRDQWPEASRELALLRRGREGYVPPAWYAADVMAVELLEIERSGQPGRAVSVLAQWLEPEQHARLLPRVYRSLPTLARLCLDAGHEPTARTAAGAAVREAARDPLTRKQATAWWCRGLVDGDPAAVLAAAGTLRESGLVLDAAAAFEDAAVLLARAGEPAQARTALSAALELYAKVGAVWDTRRAAARVREFGIRLGVRGLRRRPQTGWDSLTGAERKVAELLAAGQSNPAIATQLFISRRTVESHVSRILAKLQISSRWEVKNPSEHAAAGPR